MVVVVIVGVLAAIALPRFTNYLQRTKTSEATGQLKLLYTNVQTYYSQARSGGGLGSEVSSGCSVSSSGLVPTPVPNGSKVRTDYASNETFKQIGFSLSDPHYYSYAVVNIPGASCSHTAGLLYRLEAQGNLDGDAVLSTFSMEVGVKDDGTLYRSPNFSRINETE